MKTQFPKRSRGGFTLVELLVAMAITALIVTVLVSITAIATDTWTRSRTELRGARQAKSMMDALARDFASLVTRQNNPYEWLVAIRPSTLPGTGALESANAAELVFLTAATDRYDGDLTKPGDVSCVGYLLEYKDPIDGGTTDFSTFVLNRHVVDPDVTFTELLAKADLLTAFAAFRADMQKTKNFVCENVYQFTVIFHVEWMDVTVNPPKTKVSQLTVGPNNLSEFRFKGTGIEAVGTLPSNMTTALLKAGRLVGVEVSLTVLSDSAMTRIRKVGLPTGTGQAAKFLAANSRNYSQFIPISTP